MISKYLTQVLRQNQSKILFQHKQNKVLSRFFSNDNKGPNLKEQFEKMNQDKNQDNQKQNIFKEFYQNSKEKLKNMRNNNEPVQQQNDKNEDAKKEENIENMKGLDEEFKQRQDKQNVLESKLDQAREKLKQKSPKASKVVEYLVDALEQTFPSENIQKKKFLKQQQLAKLKKEQEEQKKEYTEEELQQMEESIPEWKKNMMTVKEQEQIKKGLRDRLKEKVMDKVNQTETAKNIYNSEQYKEFQEVKTEMKQFKLDLKERIESSNSKVVQLGLTAHNLIKNESSSARAIRIMKELKPDFSVFQLEEECRQIFEITFNAYLREEFSYLEKVCGEQCLSYFKVLLKQQEAKKSTPKFKSLWSVGQSQWQFATVPDKQLPLFTFTIAVQELHCQISTIDGKIVDGDEERIMSVEYNVVLKLHEDPDLETVGHSWELHSIEPRQVTKLLV